MALRHIGGEEVYHRSFWTLDGVSGQFDAPVALTLIKETLVPINRRLYRPQSLTGLFGTKKFLALAIQ